MSPEVVVDDLQGLRRRLATELESRARAAIADRGTFSIALPGGSVAEAFFPSLARIAVDWSRIDFFWIDERAVPPDDSDSNYGLASRLWLMPARVPPSRIHRLHAEETDLDQAARMASEELLAIVGDPPCLDVALVGVGEDGHVASLFPGRELPPPRSASPDRRSLGEGGQPCPEVLVAAVYDSPKPPRRRLTFTMPVLCGAERVIVATLGRSKASVVRDALEEKDCTTPLAELLRRAQSSLVLLEKTD